MAQEDRRPFPISLAYVYCQQHDLQEQAAEIRNMDIEWDLSYTTTLRKGYMVRLLETNDLLNQFMDLHWPPGKTKWGESRRRFYLNVWSRYQDFLAGKPSDETMEGSEDDAQQFVAEADLRNVLAGNLECIEPGLRLYQADGVTGLEYQIDDGRIDILAVDKKGQHVVIELKLSRGRNKALGQILYYMGWVDEHLDNPPSRGMIVAKEIPPDLQMAAKRVTGVALYRYKLQISADRVL